MQKSYKPFHIVLFILGCLIILGLVSYAVPSGKKDILGYEFRFLSQHKLLKTETRQEVNVDSLFADIDTSIVEDIDLSDSIDEPKEKIKNYKVTTEDLLAFSEGGKEKFRLFFNKDRKSTRLNSSHVRI